MLREQEIREAESILRFEEYRRQVGNEKMGRREKKEWDEICPKCGARAEWEGTIDTGTEIWSCAGCGATIDIVVEVKRYFGSLKFWGEIVKYINVT